MDISSMAMMIGLNVMISAAVSMVIVNTSMKKIEDASVEHLGNIARMTSNIIRKQMPKLVEAIIKDREEK